MYKKLISGILILSVVFSSAYAKDSRAISVYVDNNRIVFDSQPYLNQGYTMVPMRAIMEALGASVSWEEDSKTATAIYSSDITKFTIGSHDYYKNGAMQYMPAPAQQLNDRTYVPLRAISEGFGFKVDWDGETSTVYITSQKASDPQENIYYLKGANGGYLTAADNAIKASAEPSPEAMWAIECADSAQRLYYIYSLSDLYNPMGYCSHANEEENLQSEQQTQKQTKTADGDQAKEPAKPEEEAESLRLCSELSHQWIIEPADNGRYRIYPKNDGNSCLDADTAGTKGEAQIELIPCV
ncbi:MAG: hypothetical protein IJ460_00600 [Clostridia bacterium]|nr:hypothetical protein [Clostridia bacterium]